MPDPPVHDHLDRQRRERGLCAACDAAWRVQDEVVARYHWDEVAASHGKTDRQRLAELGRRRYGPLS